MLTLSNSVAEVYQAWSDCKHLKVQDIPLLMEWPFVQSEMNPGVGQPVAIVLTVQRQQVYTVTMYY